MSDLRLARLRVMVVDDNHHMVNLVKTILHGFGIKDVIEAHDAVEAFEILRSSEMDFLIVDIAMEPLNGIEFVTLVGTADDSPAPYVPIIMLTAYSERSKVMAARDAGATEFCSKPVTATEIYRKVAAVINKPGSFIRARAYFGPDRRRHAEVIFQGADRRKVSSNPIRAPALDSSALADPTPSSPHASYPSRLEISATPARRA